MTTRNKRRKFDTNFKEAVALVTEQGEGYSISIAANAVDVSENNLRRWKKHYR